MTGAILNFYGFMKNGKYNVHYDIGGTFFFIKPDTAITAFHLLNKKYFDLNDFINKQSFFIGQHNFIAEVEKRFIMEYENIDLSIIKFPKQLSSSHYDISADEPVLNQEFIAEGFVAGEQPDIDVKNDKFKIILNKVNLSGLTFLKQQGYVKKLLCATLKSDDMDLKEVNTIQTSFGGYVGMSGGPLIDKKNKNIIGFMSYGDPVDTDKKEVLYAVDCTELAKVIL